MEKVVSGIRPTGNLHLGNYFGAVKSFVKMQDEYECMFFIADWHSLTTHPKPGDIQESARIILAEYLACGLDIVLGKQGLQASLATVYDHASVVLERAAQSGLALGSDQIFVPFGLGLLGVRGEHFHLVTARQPVRQRHQLVVHLSSDAVCSQLGVQRKRHVEHR